MSNKLGPTGVVLVLVSAEGTEIATATDFKRDRPGGYGLHEAQRLRAKRELARRVLDALAAPRLTAAIDAYEGERILARMVEQGHRIVEVQCGNDEP